MLTYTENLQMLCSFLRIVSSLVTRPPHPVVMGHKWRLEQYKQSTSVTQELEAAGTESTGARYFCRRGRRVTQTAAAAGSGIAE
jgi:hypothetical protein